MNDNGSPHDRGMKDLSQAQVGGSHYKDKPIQPYDINRVMGDYEAVLRGSILKYVMRYREKNGVVDLKKAQHCLALLIQAEECNDEDASRREACRAESESRTDKALSNDAGVIDKGAPYLPHSETFLKHLKRGSGSDKARR